MAIRSLAVIPSKPASAGAGTAIGFLYELQVLHHVGGRVLFFLSGGQGEENCEDDDGKEQFFHDFSLSRVLRKNKGKVTAGNRA